jgi:hypothetical protein
MPQEREYLPEPALSTQLVEALILKLRASRTNIHQFASCPAG